MKICGVCKIEKSVDEFHFRNKAAGTRKYMCKACVKAYDVIAYKEGKKKGNNKISAQALTKRNRDFIINLLSNSSCVDCGNTDIRVLEFDHLRDKKYNVSGMITSYGLDKIKEEIEKCEIVCSNCHRIRTYTRNNCYRIMVA